FHQEKLSRLYLVDVHVDDIRAQATVRDTWRSLQECSQIAPRTRDGEPLERVSTGEHEGDHRACQILAEPECSGHREDRDDVHARLATEETAKHVDDRRDEHDQGGRGPGQLPRASFSEEMEQGPGCKPEHRGAQQDDPSACSPASSHRVRQEDVRDSGRPQTWTKNRRPHGSGPPDSTVCASARAYFSRPSACSAAFTPSRSETRWTYASSAGHFCSSGPVLRVQRSTV